MKITIIDYDIVGNLNSIQSAIKKIGYDSLITHNKADIKSADRIILPGVGAFEKGMEGLKKNDLIETLNFCCLDKKIPTLGICLGLQLMAKKSFEFGNHKGLGWINGNIVKFPNNKKFPLPQIGWNDVYVNNNDLIFNNLNKKEILFFANSYYIKLNEDQFETSNAEYGLKYTTSIRKNNLVGLQFHPEKSQSVGLSILKNFILWENA
jgi:glutamine amidotransferase